VTGSRFLGAVLAGGRSARFGSDKALAVLDGERLLDRAVRVLDGVCAEVIVVSSNPEHDAVGRDRVPDERPGMGPLAGIHAALGHAARLGAPGVVVLACDLPGVDTAVLRTLIATLGGADAVALGREGPPGFEPLCAVYRTECATAAAELLEDGARAAHRLLTAVDGRVTRGPDAHLVNVNTPEDLESMKRTRSDDPEPAAAEVDRAPEPTVVCVVGKKKSGKTTTVVGLVAELAGRGHEVMTVKHGHDFDVDREGSDSWKHRHMGGASRVVLSGPDDFAVMGRWRARDGREPPLEEVVRRFLSDADIVIVEGFKASGFPRIEVFRRAAHPFPIVGTEEGGAPERYLCVLTDDPTLDAPCPVWDVNAPDRFSRLADLVEGLHRRRPSAPDG
jgi:molybdopterin-guanine dinucleotide biosynthesis protein MobB